MVNDLLYISVTNLIVSKRNFRLAGIEPATS